MRSERPRRRVRGAMVPMVLALLFAVLRVLAPGGAVAAADPFDQLVRASICHANAGADAGAEDGGTRQAPAHQSCALCPSCHLAGHPLLPVPGGPAAPRPPVGGVATAAPTPPATGPPPRILTAAQPTGPPLLPA